MVSFSCEACGDTLKKPKLDQHRGRCYGAIFTCLDCNTTFNGTDYRTHTSCISESEKYQKSLYKGPKKGQNGQQNGTTPKKQQNTHQNDTTVKSQNKEENTKAVVETNGVDKTEELNGNEAMSDDKESKKKKKDKKRKREEAEKVEKEGGSMTTNGTNGESIQSTKKSKDDEETADSKSEANSKKKKKRKDKTEKQSEDTKSKNTIEETVQNLLKTKEQPIALEELIDTVAENDKKLGSREDIIRLMLQHSTIETDKDATTWSVRLHIQKN